MSHLVFIAKTGVSSLFYHCFIIVLFHFLRISDLDMDPNKDGKIHSMKILPIPCLLSILSWMEKSKRNNGERNPADTAGLNKASADVIYKPCSPLKVSNEPQLFAFLISCRYYKLRGVRRFNQKE